MDCQVGWSRAVSVLIWCIAMLRPIPAPQLNRRSENLVIKVLNTVLTNFLYGGLGSVSRGKRMALEELPEEPQHLVISRRESLETFEIEPWAFLSQPCGLKRSAKFSNLISDH